MKTKDNFNEQIKKVVKNHIEIENQELTDLVIDIVVKINDFKKKKVTSIAELIGYNPNVTYVEPLKQGEVSYIVNKVCKELNIKLEHDKSLGGLAYMQKFVKY